MKLHLSGESLEIPNFRMSEFDCPCCGMNNLDDMFLYKLQLARTEARIPFIITSGCRCEKHNKEVGGVDDSDHLTGQAADIIVKTSRDRWKIVSSAISCGFKRIGIGKTFIHLGDNWNNPQNVIWLY